MKKSELRGFSIFEHGCFLKYDIILDDKNKYYETFKNSAVMWKVQLVILKQIVMDS